MNRRPLEDISLEKPFYDRERIEFLEKNEGKPVNSGEGFRSSLDSQWPTLEVFNRRAAIIYACSVLFALGSGYIGGRYHAHRERMNEINEHFKRRKLDSIDLNSPPKPAPVPSSASPPPTGKPVSEWQEIPNFNAKLYQALAGMEGQDVELRIEKNGKVFFREP